MGSETERDGIVLETKEKLRFNKKQSTYWVLTLITAVAGIAANVSAAKVMGLPFGLSSTAGIITMPIMYVCGDVLTEVYGFKNAFKAAMVGYGLNILATIIFMIAIILPNAGGVDQTAFEAVLSQSPRIVLASLAAFVAGSTLNNKIMDSMHIRNGERHVFLRCVVSTLAGETLDKICFVLIGFLGIIPVIQMVRMVCVQSIIAILYEAIAYPLVTRWVMKWCKNLED